MCKLKMISTFFIYLLKKNKIISCLAPVYTMLSFIATQETKLNDEQEKKD